tara:strand:+ start:50 stop:1240 length:1191 start_codon:yes stop_codon:yes gene_type:complete
MAEVNYNFNSNEIPSSEFSFTTPGLGLGEEYTIPAIDFNNGDAFTDGLNYSSDGFKFLSDKADKDKQKARLSNYAKRRQGGVLRYPLEALTEHTDYLQIDIEAYVPIGEGYVSKPGNSSRNVTGNYFGSDRAGRRSSGRLSKKPLINAGTILLPIPTDLQDANQVQYGSSELNGMAATGVQAAEDVMNTSFREGQDPFGQLQQAYASAKSRVVDGVGTPDVAKNALTKFLAAKAVNVFGGNVTLNQLLARGSGEVLNPNMELLFNGPTLRNFRFNYKLTPRNAKEAEQVKLIIRAFKRNMAPQAQGGSISSGNWFLKTPNVFSLRYRTGRKNHPFLNRFKQCFLSDMSVRYTGEGVHATYEDGTPVSMVLDLSFKEITPIYDIDYDTKPGSEAVGY